MPTQTEILRQLIRAASIEVLTAGAQEQELGSAGQRRKEVGSTNEGFGQQGKSEGAEKAAEYGEK